MGEKRFAKSPLLYIHQRSTNEPKARMQHQYRTPRKTEGESTAKQNNTEEKPPKQSNMRPIKRKVHPKPAQKELANTEESEQEKERESEQHNNQTLKFKDMSLEEKVNYFVKTPTYVPKLRCEVKTDERTYRGIIVDYKENNVYMRIGRRTSITTIPFDTIKQIRMLGF